MLQVRKTNADILVYVFFELLKPNNEYFFSFSKAGADGRRKALVVCKFSSGESEFPNVAVVGMQQRILIVDNLGGG